MNYSVYSPDANWKGFAELKEFKHKVNALNFMRTIRKYGHIAIMVFLGGLLWSITDHIPKHLRALGEPPLSWYTSLSR